MLKSLKWDWNRGKFLVLGLILFSFICWGFIGSDDFEQTRMELMFRKIGHELLLQSGDSSSRVMPVQQKDHLYQIRFEHPLGLMPDSLVAITERILGKDELMSDYAVSVLNCGKDSVVYGYAITKHHRNDIVSCKGRKLPVACYMVQIQVKQGLTSSKLVLGGLPLLAFVGLLFWVKRPKKVALSEPALGVYHLGELVFDARNRKLLLRELVIDLTATESRVLEIFALSPNEVIERSRIQKEIWEDEGVIVGRSLDMFISKLRKKLEVDLRVKIVVVRGIGYRLEVG